MLGMMNCQTENYEFYASPPSSSSVQLRQQDAIGQQQADGCIELFSNQKQKKPQITYTEDGRRLIDGKLEVESRQEPSKLWNRVIVDNLTARRLGREPSNRKEEEEATEEEAERKQKEGKKKLNQQEKEEYKEKEEGEEEEKEENGEKKEEDREEKEEDREEKEEDREEKEENGEEEKEEKTMGANGKQKHKSSFSGILSKLKPRKKQSAAQNSC